MTPRQDDGASCNFPTANFTDVIRDVSAGSPRISQSEYLASGLYPVIDQGRNAVAGYVDDQSALCRADLPVILFGDQTRRLKFLEAPFAVGADGVKLLATSPLLDPKFAFRFLQSLVLPDGGYSRHFKFLKQTRVPLPSMKEQRRIASILDRADQQRVSCRHAIEAIAALKASSFEAVFGSISTTHETVVPLDDLIATARPLTYGILMPGPDVEGGVPYVRVMDIRSGAISSERLPRTTPIIAESYRRSTLRQGDLLMSIRGHVGRTAVVPAGLIGANITQDTARIALDGISSAYVSSWLATPQVVNWLKRHTKGVAVRGINLQDVKRIPIPVPTRSQQDEFDRVSTQVASLDVKFRAQLALLDELFASLQHRAFRGEL